MTFVTEALLFGAGLVVVPIILHLIMRQRPKLLEFPPLRFIQRRHDTNQRRLRLRHLLLLLLRAGAIALLALALARPSIKLSSRLGSQEAPVAAALIFDASPHMEYLKNKQSRLEAAGEFGQRLLEQLPPDSQVAVFDSGMSPRSFDADRGLSKQRIQQLEIVSNPRPLTRIVSEAAVVLKNSSLPAKEIYVFTDLSRASWPSEEAPQLQQRLHDLPGVVVYLVDVGEAEPADFALGDLRLSQQVVAAGGSVELLTDISSVGTEGSRAGEVARSVELDLAGPSDTLTKTSEQIHQLKPGDSQTVVFRLAALKPGTRQGRVRIVGKDSLAADDVRYFTVEVRPPWPVLIAAPSPAAETSVYFAEAIAPAEMRQRHDARFDCTVIGYGDLSAQNLDKFSAVFLLDPPALEAGSWQHLTDYAAAGHGVGVFLGRQAAIESLNSQVAQQLLPAKVREQHPREDGDTYLAPQNYQHPILKPFASFATRTPWNKFPVFRYWRIDDLAHDAGTVIAYNDGGPAVVERTLRAGDTAGHVLMMTTPLSDRVSRRDAWNWLPGSSEMGGWPFVILANEMASYLVGSGEQQLNYLAGANSVSLAVDDAAQGRAGERARAASAPGDDDALRHYVLVRPDGKISPLSSAEKGRLSISSVEQPGNYKVQGAVDEPDRGFSVNLSAQSTQLARMTDQEMGAIFGPYKPQVARSDDQMVRNVHEGRVGREIFPWLILVFAGVLSVEYVVSNWFYKRT